MAKWFNLRLVDDMEEAVQFSHNQKLLYGILHVPDQRIDPSTIVILITGGPQVRIGAHRIYLELSRFLCEHNYSSFRFDYEGMGDSEGDYIGFQYAGSSIAAAMRFLRKKFKGRLNFIIWSLCDGATAAALYAANHQDYIIGQILCNPLVMTDDGLAISTIRYYYIKKIFSKNFLRKLRKRQLNLKNSVKSLWGIIKDAQRLNKDPSESAKNQKLPDIVIDSLHIFPKPIRIILSNGDIVASNFRDELKKNNLLKNDYKSNKIINYFINGADHTFVKPMAKKEMFAITLKAVNEIASLESGKFFPHHDTHSK